MPRLPFAIAVFAVACTTQLAAQDRAAVLATVNQFVDAFNRGDPKAAVACAAETSIIDEFPPHEWHGRDACARWMQDYDSDAKKNGITDGVVLLGTPKHVDVSGNVAYVVIPSSYAYKKQGKPVKETDSAFAFALRKEGAGWRITGWSWAKN
jgi:ketosteroid isomerase-like protein